MPRDLDPRTVDRDHADRSRDARDPLTRDLDLPRGPHRESVRRGRWEGMLRGTEVHVLATVGAFRVVPVEDLRRPDNRSTLQTEVAHLQRVGLVRTMPYLVGRARTTLVTLTEQGREVLHASRRDHTAAAPQAFYAGFAHPRELAHDARVYRAYLDVGTRVSARGLTVRRVVLEHELKREYQQFLQAPNRGRRDSDGRSPRTADDIARWAQAHTLPMHEDHVQFPDLRLECEDREGRPVMEDIEVMTPHYRGAHAAAKVRAGFTRYDAVGTRISGTSRVGRSGRGRDVHLAEEMLS